jgi:hypothetical protein
VRNRTADYGRSPTPRDPGQVATGDNVILDAADVARLTVESILAGRLYILPHQAARASIRRRFERIDRTFDEQAAEGWAH